MSSRTYLSIGDVLTLLRQEFPDVTISKIRFLESQGLVDPERTPSGYRKFYEQDVERLRWVLRQQREHFLPLKVIKGRLDEGAEVDDDLPELEDLDVEATESVGHPVGDPFEEPVGAGRTVNGPVGESAVENSAVENSAVEDRAEDRAVDRVEAVGMADRRHRPEAVLVGQGALGASAGPSLSGPALPGFESPTPAPAPVGAADMAAATFVAVSQEEPEKSPPTASGRRGPSTRPGTSKAAGNKAAAKAASTTGAGAPEPVLADVPVSTVSGSSMTIEELASATGLTVSDVQQLESFGLVVGRAVGGVTYYDDDALTIARTAAGFARFGVEARHLRFHKHAAEREAGFIEQIVLPLLKQRNPEARQRAHDNVAELTRLGQSLRTVLLRNALRDQLGG